MINKKFLYYIGSHIVETINRKKGNLHTITVKDIIDDFIAGKDIDPNIKRQMVEELGIVSIIDHGDEIRLYLKPIEPNGVQYDNIEIKLGDEIIPHKSLKL